jgi:solute carrier family 13 (sodium-dependent dicarboxylate transporter), member 2/3/5
VTPNEDMSEETSPLMQRVGLWLGPALALLVLVLPVPTGMSAEAWRVVALSAVMAVWWITEPVPMAITAFLPILFLPLAGIATLKEATSPFAEPIIFLLLGGVIVALAIERWGLHKRIALFVLSHVGTSPRRLVLGFMIATAFMSMWISNSATTMMMLPIAVSVIAVLQTVSAEDKNFSSAVLLGVAYAASLGGMATIVGTPPNAMAVSYVRQTFGAEIGFLQWMKIGVPVLIIALPLFWLLLTRISFKVSATPIVGAHEVILHERQSLGPWSRAEIRVAVLFTVLALAWMFSAYLKQVPGLEKISDEMIAMAFAILMFLVPSGLIPGEKLLAWRDTVKINWGVIFLFGGGLSLAAAMDKTGLARWLGDHLVLLKEVPPFVLILVLVASVTFLSEIASNTALVAALMPVLGAASQATGLDPTQLAIPVALAASCGFMLPAATGPNAIIFGTGRIKATEMARTGFLLDWIGIITIAFICWLSL